MMPILINCHLYTRMQPPVTILASLKNCGQLIHGSRAWSISRKRVTFSSLRKLRGIKWNIDSCIDVSCNMLLRVKIFCLKWSVHVLFKLFWVCNDLVKPNQHLKECCRFCFSSRILWQLDWIQLNKFKSQVVTKGYHPKEPFFSIRKGLYCWVFV